MRPPAPSVVPNVYYKYPFFDRILGHYTAEWGENRVRTFNRVQDWEHNFPSLYSVLRLPYVLRTYMEGRQSFILKKPMPFIVLDAIRRLDGLIEPGMRVLEVGAGNSTLWFLEKGCDVVSFEHDRAWATSILAAAGDNSRLTMNIAGGDEAVKGLALLPDATFDLALIDSTGDIPSFRCTPDVMMKVRSGGWVVLDNSDMPANWLAVDMLGRESREYYVGYAPMALKVSQTSIWAR